MSTRNQHPANIERLAIHTPWDDWELNIALNHVYTDLEVARRTGRSLAAVKLKREYEVTLTHSRAVKRDRFQNYCAQVDSKATRKNKPWTSKEHETLVAMRRRGYRIVDMALALSRTYSATSAYIRRHLQESE